MQQTFLQVGVVLLACGVKLFDLESFEYIFNELVTLLDHFSVFILGFCLVSQFVAVGHTIGNFEQLLGNLGHSEVLAFLDLSK